MKINHFSMKIHHKSKIGEQKCFGIVKVSVSLSKYTLIPHRLLRIMKGIVSFCIVSV